MRAAEEAPARPSREPAPAEAPPPAPENTVKLWVNLGRADGHEPAAIGGMVADLAKVDASKITRVDAHPKHSYVFVETDAADAVAQASGEKDGRRVRIERAKR